MSRFKLTKVCREELGLILAYAFYVGNVNELQMILDEIQIRNFIES